MPGTPGIEFKAYPSKVVPDEETRLVYQCDLNSAMNLNLTNHQFTLNGPTKGFESISGFQNEKVVTNKKFELGCYSALPKGHIVKAPVCVLPEVAIRLHYDQAPADSNVRFMVYTDTPDIYKNCEANFNFPPGYPEHPHNYKLEYKDRIVTWFSSSIRKVKDDINLKITCRNKCGYNYATATIKVTDGVEPNDGDNISDKSEQ